MDTPKLYNENELLLQLRSGDERAFEILYKLHSKVIYRKIMGMVKVADIADEITQGVFVKVWQKRELIDPDRKFILYVLQMAGNLVYDFYRRLAREQRLQDEVIAVSTQTYSHVEEQIALKESMELIDSAISSLPKQQQLVFTLCKVEGKSYAEVSRLLGISESTISNHIVQATKTMRILVSKSATAVASLAVASLLYA